MHTHIHTHTHTHMHTHIHTHTCTHTHMYAHTHHLPTSTHTHTQFQTLKYFSLNALLSPWVKQLASCLLNCQITLSKRAHSADTHMHAHFNSRAHTHAHIHIFTQNLHFCVGQAKCFNQKAHLSPRIKQSPSSSLHHQITAVPRRLTTVLKSVDVVTETGQVVLHPAGPVTAVAAVDEVGALQKNSSSSHNWCFLYTTATRYLLYIPDYKMLLKINRIPQI